jgi:hypothetical protein
MVDEKKKSFERLQNRTRVFTSIPVGLDFKLNALDDFASSRNVLFICRANLLVACTWIKSMRPDSNKSRIIISLSSPSFTRIAHRHHMAPNTHRDYLISSGLKKFMLIWFTSLLYGRARTEQVTQLRIHAGQMTRVPGSNDSWIFRSVILIYYHLNAHNKRHGVFKDSMQSSLVFTFIFLEKPTVPILCNIVNVVTLLY